MTDDATHWQRACNAAPTLSEKAPPYFIGDLIWPDGSDKTDSSTMLVWDGEKWVCISEPMDFKVAMNIKGITAPTGFCVYGSDGL